MFKKRLLCLSLAITLVLGSQLGLTKTSLVYAEGETNTDSSDSSNDGVTSDQTSEDSSGQPDTGHSSDGTSDTPPKSPSAGDSAGGTDDFSGDSSPDNNGVDNGDSTTGSFDAGSAESADSSEDSDNSGSDISACDPADIIAPSYTLVVANPVHGLSKAVREKYRKIEAQYGISKQDGVEVFEEKLKKVETIGDEAEKEAETAVEYTRSRVVGTLENETAVYVLVILPDCFYIESEDVRGYVKKEDLVYGAEAKEFIKRHALEILPTATTIVPLEENEAADDFHLTAYQFEKKEGLDFVEYARRFVGLCSDTHRKYEKRLAEMNSERVLTPPHDPMTNAGFITAIYSFYDLYEPEAETYHFTHFGTEVADPEEAEAGDLFILDNDEYGIYTGEDSLIICYSKEKDEGLAEEKQYAVKPDENAEKELIFKVCEVSAEDVTILQVRRPNYDEQLKSEDVIPDEDTLIGATVEEQCWYYFTNNLGLSDEATAGALGNIFCESGFKTGNLENWVNSVLNCTDEQFTAAVDTGVYTYDQFLNDKYAYPTGKLSQWGYGLIGFTSKFAKEALWQNTVAMGRSLSDLKGQLDAVAQIYGEKLSWVSSESPEQAAADWFYYIEMGNPLGGTHGYGYEYTIPKRQAYAAAFYEALHK